ncbi:LysM peptidoglycan-binding domain-containing protein [Mycobacterium sp.]|jgi:LysM repeat protein|uniref:LysM peptidoglycan-binding domain-containing protein n=1 Tax=Mycobacterium sp. TaxID=1785 RepID=UPI003BB03B56
MSRKYQIQAGDTLSAVAKRFYGDASYFGLIAAANNLADPNKIAPGQVLSIPDLPTHWDVVQATGWNSIQKTGVLSINVACTVPAGMRLVIENVSAQCVLQPGTLAPLIMGEIDVLGRPANPLAFFPWIQSFYSGDINDAITERWFAFHSATRIYVAGPVQNLTFSAGFGGTDADQSGLAEVHICVNGYLEAAPTA